MCALGPGSIFIISSHGQQGWEGMDADSQPAEIDGF